MMNCKHRWISAVLALAVVFGTLLPFYATYNHEVAPPQKLTLLFGEKVLICTGEGFVLVKWSDLMAGKTPVKQHKEFFCPLCYVAASPLHKMLPLAAITIPTPHEHTSADVLFFQPGSRPQIFAWQALRPRAPPVPFFS